MLLSRACRHETNDEIEFTWIFAELNTLIYNNLSQVYHHKVKTSICEASILKKIKQIGADDVNWKIKMKIVWIVCCVWNFKIQSKNENKKNKKNLSKSFFFWFCFIVEKKQKTESNIYVYGYKVFCFLFFKLFCFRFLLSIFFYVFYFISWIFLCTIIIIRNGRWLRYRCIGVIIKLKFKKKRKKCFSSLAEKRSQF